METIDEEEIKEQLKEEMAKFEDDGYFRRLIKMFVGLGRPRNSPEYKEAIVELQRQTAPLLAILLPILVVATLFVVTAVSGAGKRELKVEIVQADQQDDALEEIETPQETEPPPEMDNIEITVDAPSMNPTEMASEAAPAPTAEPQSVKVASVDAMLSIKSPVKMKSVMGTSRGAGVRGTYTRGGASYGDAATEAAVMKALRWLKATQQGDGSWPTWGSLEGFKNQQERAFKEKKINKAAYDGAMATYQKYKSLGLEKGMDAAAGAGFAILAYLAHGETPASKEFGPTVQKALDYLINSVYVVKGKDGKPVKDPNGNTPYIRMWGAGGSEYGFLIGTYALCEAYGMTKNPNAREAAEKTLGRIISGQTATGGWNYNMARVTKDGPDDISFGGWAMQAIKAGKMAGIHLPGMEECIKKAVNCLKKRNYSEKAGFVYRATTNHKGGTGGLAGVGCLAMQLLGYAKEKEVANALNVMRDWQPSLDKVYSYAPGKPENPQYYCYYAAQCKYQAGMCKDATPANFTLWKKWNAEMKALYTKAVITVTDKSGQPVTVKDPAGKDRPIGRWENKDHYNYDVMGTCLAALQLMVYYRYLPTTQLKATEVEADVETLSKDKSGEINVTIDI